MKTTELINILMESLRGNGDLEISGIVNGEIYSYCEINRPDRDSPLYIELYKE